jgi:hypothetical protein
MVGIPGFLGHDGREFESNGVWAITRAQQALSVIDKQDVRQQHEKQLRGIDVDNIPDPSQSVSAASYRFVKAIQDRLDDRLIRRTINSRKPDGSVINNKLPPLIRHPITIILPEDEMQALHGKLKRREDEFVRCCP